MAREDNALAEPLLPVHFVARDVPLADAFQDRVRRSLAALQRIFPNMQDAKVVVRKERGQFVVEVTLKVARYLLRAQEKGRSIRAAFDRAMDKIDRQLHRYKERLIDRRRHAQPLPAAVAPQPAEPSAPPTPLPIARIKRFPVKPMTIDEAAVQMDLLGHDFFVFVNAETGKVNVLYRRRAGDLGLLEPGEDEE
ncbi:Ribosome hibernation promotion factor [bacterium HR17]|uniref:Ribosome hibernation promoting factor n=1 Tax=Candidatus Fervidibacter japonicus TaxID=2035412 RepID=A0A2H5XFJ0_9BACT|nr:Ribosome hibernation promotion factor [bacterium HR17]